MQEGLLPLFPLQVVLFPGAELPLHIFEDRYKEMIGEAVRDHLEFGVVLASDKGLVNTGCTATVERVLKQYPDGRMDILALGRRRFEILLLNNERAFLRGAVEFFDDEKADPASPEIHKLALDGYNEMQALLSQRQISDEELAAQQSVRRRFRRRFLGPAVEFPAGAAHRRPSPSPSAAGNAQRGGAHSTPGRVLSGLSRKAKTRPARQEHRTAQRPRAGERR